MITGIVTPALEASISLVIHNASGAKHAVTAVIDTGFNGSLTLSLDLIADLDLTLSGRDSAVLADGSEKLFDFYQATIEWDGSTRQIAVLAADSDPLVGMALIAGHELTIRAIPGGAVTIAALS